MNKKHSKTERLHSLDSLRAVMMLLGVVLHSALTYVVANFGDEWVLKDPNSTHLFADFFVFFIHSFRMPVFFFVAGFFGSMLFYERGPLKMVKNRVTRILYPFIIFLILLWPIIFFCFNYTEAVFLDTPSSMKKLMEHLYDFSFLIPSNTFHLWFLYYLILFTMSAVLLSFFLKKTKRISNVISSYFEWLMIRPFIRILFFSGVSTLIFVLLKTSIVRTSVSLIPDWKTFVFYFQFYMVGWVLFKSKHLLNAMMKFDRLFVMIAILLVSGQSLLIQMSNFELLLNSDTWGMISLSSISIWLFIFGIVGLFLRYASKTSRKARYISDSSYWVYLIHLPIVAIVPAFIYNWAIPAFVKFLIVLAVTIIISFSTYHFFVRGTFVGLFLNGRKYKRKSIK